VSIEPFLKCSDIKVSLNFYTNLLDFKVVQAPDPDPEAFMSMYAYLKREESFIHLSQHAGDGVFGNVIYVQVKDIDEIYTAFLNNGLKKQEKSGIAMEPVEQAWGMKEFYVADPDGNRIRFGQQIA
jgi:catechol 2,3-dioxygenase-like lactoylglutathione lyase family enzyme